MGGKRIAEQVRRFPSLWKQMVLFLVHAAWTFGCFVLAAELARHDVLRMLVVFAALWAPGYYVAYRYRRHLFAER